MQPTDDGKIECLLCKGRTHSIEKHLTEAHPGVTLAQYQEQFPSAPILSEKAKVAIAEHLAKKEAAAKSVEVAHAATVAPPALHVVGGDAVERKAFHELFGLDPAKEPESLSTSKKPIPIVIANPGRFTDMVPAIDLEHVFDVNVLKNTCMAIELGMPVYLWGHSGTGKTTTIKQIAARTRRPWLRVQHSINTEECHIVGQWTARAGETIFQLGPLAQSMLNGWLYVADEYDFALPSVLAVYQPVLEGEPLIIKDAPDEFRVIRPHPNFRLAATGNTNGSGDDTGLYQGTQIQNAANYERFGVVEQVRYMAAHKEKQIIVNKAKVAPEDAEKLVDFATRVREAYDKNTVSSTVSPRALVHAGKLGLRRASFRIGLNLAFINRLSKVDREAVDGIAQRIFGEGK
jgi:cobaltochelatase CobS